MHIDARSKASINTILKICSSTALIHRDEQLEYQEAITPRSFLSILKDDCLTIAFDLLLKQAFLGRGIGTW